MIIDKSKFLDNMGKPLTQGLFLEIGYSDYAIYTLKEQDHEYKGKAYYSLKQLYLEMEDPTEYQFANTYLLNWNQWKRLLANKIIRRYIDEWREELELKLRVKGVQSMMKSAQTGNYQAAKWLADKGWEVRSAGRPSKADIEKELAIQTKISEDYSADIIRLGVAKG